MKKIADTGLLVAAADPGDRDHAWAAAALRAHADEREHGHDEPQQLPAGHHPAVRRFLLGIVNVGDHHAPDRVIRPVGENKTTHHHRRQLPAFGIDLPKSGTRNGAAASSCARSSNFLCRRRGTEMKNATEEPEKTGR